MVVATTLVSIGTAIWADKNEMEAIREMATGAFGGAIIGALILFYEQRREEWREINQDARDEAQAARIQLFHHKEADIRSLADFMLKEFHPFYHNFFNHITHTGRGRGCEKFKELADDLNPMLTVLTYYAKRVDKKMWRASLDIRKGAIELNNKQLKDRKKKFDAERLLLDKMVGDLLSSAEKRLSEN